MCPHGVSVYPRRYTMRDHPIGFRSRSQAFALICREVACVHSTFAPSRAFPALTRAILERLTVQRLVASRKAAEAQVFFAAKNPMSSMETGPISQTSGQSSGAKSSNTTGSTQSSPLCKSMPDLARRPANAQAMSETTLGACACRIPRHGTVHLNRGRRRRMQGRQQPPQSRRHALDNQRRECDTALQCTVISIRFDGVRDWRADNNAS